MSDASCFPAEGLVKRFGGITATTNVTLNLRRGAATR
jgi:ABC-type branched-subunit amino acid transport system ATPase component